MESILAIIFIFGGGTLFLLSLTQVGKAFADRLRHGPVPLAPPDPDPAIYDELDRLRAEVNELHERVDFTERLLASSSKDAAASEGGS